MELTMLKAKIHRATVTQADVNYVGSVTIDSLLLEEAGILEYEKVQVVDVDNGNRFEAYTIAGEPGSGIICLNGAAAHCVTIGDKVIIMAYANMSPEEAAQSRPVVLFLGEGNKVERKANYEKHGRLADQ